MREWGWRRAVYWQIMHLLAGRTGFHIHYVGIGPDRPGPLFHTPPATPSGYTIGWGRKEDLLPFAGRIRGLDAEFIEQAFERDDECSVAFHGDDLVHFCFVSRTWAPVTRQLRVTIPAGFRYVYKSWTHPDHRRRNLSSAASYMRTSTRVAPYDERTISYVETHNYPSVLRGYRHPNERGMGFGYVGWFTVLGRQIPFNTRRARWIGFEFSRNPESA